MSQIAYSRGDTASALAWKQQVHGTVVAEQRAADAETMEGILSQNKYMPAPGSQIVETRSDLPFHNDEERAR